jgi:hypothetical protein
MIQLGQFDTALAQYFQDNFVEKLYKFNMTGGFCFMNNTSSNYFNNIISN